MGNFRIAASGLLLPDGPFNLRHLRPPESSNSLDSNSNSNDPPPETSNSLDSNSSSNNITPSAETQQYLDRLATPPSEERIVVVNDFINNLVAGGTWTNLDILVCPFLAENQADALVDLKNLNFTGSEVNSPTWTIKEGYSFNGTNQSVDMVWNPNSGGSNFAPNSASFGVWVTAHPGATSTTKKSGSVDATASHELSMCPRNADGDPRGRINSNADISNSFPGTNGVGLFHINRSASNAAQYYKNGVAGGTSGNVAGGRSSRTMHIGAFNNNGTITGWHQATYAAWYASNSKSAAVVLDIYNRFIAAKAAIDAI